MEEGEETFGHCRGGCGRGRGRLQGLSPLAQLKPSVYGEYHECRIPLRGMPEGDVQPCQETSPLRCPSRHCAFVVHSVSSRDDDRPFELTGSCLIRSAGCRRRRAGGLHVCPSPSAGSSARGATAMDVASLVDRDGGKEREREGARMKTSQRKDGRDGQRTWRRTKDGNVAPPPARVSPGSAPSVPWNSQRSLGPTALLGCSGSFRQRHSFCR